MSRIGVTWGSAKGNHADTRPPQRGPACGRYALPIFVTGRGCPHAFWLEKVGRASRLPLEFGGGRHPQGIPQRPPATVWQPFGLTPQECSASKGRRDPCPTLRKCLGHSARTRGGYAAANEDSGWRMEDGKARRRGDSCARSRNLARNVRVVDVRVPRVSSDPKPPKATPKPPRGECRRENAE